MMLIAIIVSIALGFLVVERLWPANELPRVRAWYARVILINAIQGGIVVLAGLTLDRWLRRASLIERQRHLNVMGPGAVAKSTALSQPTIRCLAQEVSFIDHADLARSGRREFIERFGNATRDRDPSGVYFTQLSFVRVQVLSGL